MDLSEKRGVGRSGVEVTCLGFGGSTIGNIDRDRIIPESDAAAAIEAAWEGGVRYFDTAPFYGAGLGEHRTGQALRSRARDSFILSTKVGVLLEPRPPTETRDLGSMARLPFEAKYDYSYDGAMRSVEHSMQRLGLNRFDIVFIHDIDVRTHGVEGQRRRFREAMDGAYPALEELKRQGVVRAIGVGVASWEVCWDCAAAGDFDCFMLAGRYTLLEQGAIGSFLPLCRKQDISVFVAAPYNSGILAYGAVEGVHYDYKPAPPEVLERTRRIEDVCRCHGVELAAAALQFPLLHPAVATVVPGPRNAEQMRRTIGQFSSAIDPDLWRELKDGGLIDAQVPIGHLL